VATIRFIWDLRWLRAQDAAQKCGCVDDIAIGYRVILPKKQWFARQPGFKNTAIRVILPKLT
jgi:hypothetical protein